MVLIRVNPCIKGLWLNKIPLLKNNNGTCTYKLLMGRL
jgi:hypothetical protein